MLRKIPIYCGIAAPVLYVITAIVGAALRSDYSHIVNAISELISNGAPNKAILDVVFNIYNALLLVFAIGAYIALKNAPRLCRISMGILIGIQILSFSWGFFPMDPLGCRSHFCGNHAQRPRRDRGSCNHHHAFVNGAGLTEDGWLSRLR